MSTCGSLSFWLLTWATLPWVLGFGAGELGRRKRRRCSPGKNREISLGTWEKCGFLWGKNGRFHLESYGFLGRNRGDFSEHVAGRNPAVTNQGLKAGQLDPSRPYGYGSIPINTIFRGMNIHKSQLFWCELQGIPWVLTHCHMISSSFFANWTVPKIRKSEEPSTAGVQHFETYPRDFCLEQKARGCLVYPTPNIFFERSHKPKLIDECWGV